MKRNRAGSLAVGERKQKNEHEKEQTLERKLKKVEENKNVLKDIYPELKKKKMKRLLIQKRSKTGQTTVEKVKIEEKENGQGKGRRVL